MLKMIAESKAVQLEGLLHESVFSPALSCVASLHHDADSEQVEVRGVDGELKKIAESKLSIKPNFAYTLSEVRDDIQRVFDAGYFQELTPVAEDTRDGIKLTLQVCHSPMHAQPSCIFWHLLSDLKKWSTTSCLLCAGYGQSCDQRGSCAGCQCVASERD